VKFRRVALALPGLACVASFACSPSDLDRNFDEGRYLEVARAFEADSVLHDDEGALYRTGVAFALPNSEVRDPARARQLFDRLLRLHPQTTYRQQTEWLLAFLDREEELGEEVRRLDAELEELKAIDLGRTPADSTP
jgi:hypothetical protein